MKASIVIPVFNKWELTKACLESLRRTVSADLAEVVVIDNASSDETPSQLPALFPEVRYARQETNLGYAGGNNVGARMSNGEYLVLLNNDTVTEPGWLEAILAAFERHPKAAVVGSRLLYPDRHIQHAGVAFNRNRDPFHIYRNAPPDFAGVNKERQFPAVTGACFTMPLSLYRELGGLREDYLNGYEDVDLCLQVRDRGYEVWYVPSSVVVHFESQTPGRKKHEAENRSIFFGRWRDKLVHDDERYYREDGFDTALFPYIDRMTHVVEPGHYLPARWTYGRATPAWLQEWLRRLQAEAQVPVELVEEGDGRYAVGRVRADFKYLTYPLLACDAPPGPDAPPHAGVMLVREDGSCLGCDATSGRSVTFTPQLCPSIITGLFSLNLLLNDPRHICEQGLRGLRSGAMDAEIYGREFAAVWPTDVHACKFDTERLITRDDWTGARERLTRFYNDDRFNSYVTLKLAEVLIHEGARGQARPILQEFLRTKPVYLKARWLLLRSLAGAQA